MTYNNSLVYLTMSKINQLIVEERLTYKTNELHLVELLTDFYYYLKILLQVF